MKKVAIGLLLAGLTGLPVLANDSSAELATGGLIFVKNDDIEMRSEDLYVSPDAIKVNYRFFNKSSRDVTVRVAFPLPLLEISEQDQNISVPTEDPVNFLGFTTSVNGKRVAMQVEQRVTAKGVDHTALLQSLKVPLSPQLAATNRALDLLPKDKWDELVGLGLAEVEEYDAGKGMERHLAARWGVQTTFHWEQTFPAKREVAIEHRYKPSVGGSVQTAVGAEFAKGEPWMDDFKRKYCIDQDFLSAVERARQAAKATNPPFNEQRIDYILATGANWSGPIKSFRLVVDKGRADRLVSFCGEGVKKISPTQFEVRKTDFTPKGNLAVLILQRMPPPDR